MARRPSRLMRWAYDAPGGAVVEPPTGRAKRGWETGKRPPAQWMNALLQNAAAWADFLRSGSLSKWERVSFGSTELNPLYIVAGADNVTEDGAGSTPNRRLVIAGDDGSGPCVLVSRRGNDWTLIRNFPGGVYGSSPTSVTYLGGRWWITLDAGPYVSTNTGFLLSTLGDPQPGSNLDGSGTWTSQTLPGSVSGLVGFAFDGDKCFVAASRTDLFVSVDNGSTWSGVTPATTGGADRRTDVCFDGRAFVAIDSDGAVHKSAPGTSALSAWPHVATITVGSVPTPNWRLAVDDAGTVVAWPKSASQCPFYASTTHGGTWTEIAPAGPYPKNIHSLVFADGVWVAATQNAPFLWQSNDLQSWVPLRLPYLESESYGSVGAVTFCEGAWVAVRYDAALLGARAEDLSPGPWSPDPTPALLANAGWLQGRKLAPTAPGDGQVLVWNDGAQLWVPATPSAGSTVPWTAALAPAETRTTDDTVTTIKSIATTTNKSHLFRVEVLAAKGDRSAAWGVSALLVATNAAGSVTVSAAIALGPATVGSSIVDATTPVDFDVSGTSVRVRAKGAAGTTVDWDVAVTSIVGGGA